MGIFSKKKVVIYEETRDIQLSTEMQNRFEFRLRDIEAVGNVWI